jgi:hypothetical protein
MTPRQEEVAAQLYEDYTWSTAMLVRALGAGRRAVANALERQGVELRKSRRPNALTPVLPFETGRAWLLDAGKIDRAQAKREPAVKTLPDGRQTYKRRRCQECLTLNGHATHCNACQQPLDYTKPDSDVADIYREDLQR